MYTVGNHRCHTPCPLVHVEGGGEEGAGGVGRDAGREVVLAVLAQLLQPQVVRHPVHLEHSMVCHHNLQTWDS